MNPVTRRKFLKTALAAGATTTAGLLLGGQFPFSSTNGQSPPRNRRKWVMVIDQDLCDGCGKCTEACITEHHVPPAWGEPSFHDGGNPSFEGAQEWIMVLNQDPGNGNLVFQPTPCMNCQNAPCVKVCPVGATYYNEDGIVVIDNTRCIGCRFCMAACPYSRRYFNWGEPPHSADEVLIQYNPDYPILHRRGTVEKCIFCAHRVKNGRLPACVDACRLQGMKALYFGDANEDVVTNGEEVVRLTDMLEKGGFRMKEELGTQPSVYYLPKRS